VQAMENSTSATKLMKKAYGLCKR